MEKTNLTQYEHLQTQKKIDKILEIFKFDKDDWVCQSGEKDEEISESLNDMKATLEQSDSGIDFINTKIDDLSNEITETTKEIINSIESQNDEIFKLSQNLNDILRILKSNTN